MTSNGRRLAFLIGLVIAFMLPKRVECGYAGSTECRRVVNHRPCTMYEIEPWGFSLIERLVDRDVGFAYSVDRDC